MLTQSNPRMAGAGVLALVLIMLGTFVLLPTASAQAAPADTLSPVDLAHYFPADTAVYFSLRTDPGIIEELNVFYHSLAPVIGRMANMPPEMLPPALPALLDQLAQEEFGTDFRQAVHSWLGDGFAVGATAEALQTEFGEQVLIVIDIVDRDAAIAFWEENGGGDYERSERGEYILLSDPYTVMAFGPEVMVVAPEMELIPFDLPTTTLAANDTFIGTLDLLPFQGDYDAFIYLDSGALLGSVSAVTTPPEELEMYGYLLDAVGPIAIGATIDGHALLIDVALNSNLAGLEEALGFPLEIGQPVNPDFWYHIPADATLVLHGTNLKGVFDTLINLVRASGMPDIDKQTANLEAQLQAITGLSFHEDIIGWMTGDYALFISYTVNPDEPSLLTATMHPGQPVANLGVDIGVVFQVTDPAMTQQLINTVAPILTLLTARQEGMTVRRENIGGADAIVLTVAGPQGNFTVDLVMGANDAVLVIGTRKGAIAALSGSGGLPTSDRFNAGHPYLLGDSYMLVYADQTFVNLVGDLALLGPVIQDIFDAVIASMQPGGAQPSPGGVPPGQIRQGMQQIRELSALFNSASISSTMTDSGQIISRFALTLTPR